MKTMKKFWKYFLNFVVLVLLVYALNWLGFMNLKPLKNNQQIECFTDIENATIDNITCNDKKLEGTITNNATVLINDFYIKADFFGTNEKLLGTKYYKIKYFNVGEKAKFEIEHSYTNVSYVKISMADTIV